MEDNKLSTYITLNNGSQMPRMGLGTFGIKNVEEIVYQSIKSGIRLIDTATRYNNEREVGLGIKRAINEGIVKREDLFIVTKLYVLMRHKVEDAIKFSLEELQLDYIDLYLDHWPFPIFKDKDTGQQQNVPMHVLWSKMEELVEKRYTRSIGVSNYHVQALSNLLSFAKIKPVVDQVELHPFLIQEELVKYCETNNIRMMAYNSLGRGLYSFQHMTEEFNLLENPLVKKLAEKYNVTPGIIALNWGISHDYIVIPSTSNPERMKENIMALNFKLTDDDLLQLDGLNCNKRFNWSRLLDWSEGVEMFA
jgi:diketogulonate reductase-like aldo/keto reductase